MLRTWVVVVLWVVSVALPLHAQRQHPCLFGVLLGDWSLTQAEYLREFRVDLVDTTRTQKKSGIRIVQLTNGMQYVVRFPVSSESIKHEAFVTNMMASAPNIQVPQLRQLSVEETRELAMKMGMIGVDAREGASVAAYYPEMVEGVDFLVAGGFLIKGPRALSELEKLPIKTQIADLWAMHVVVGSEDFHYKNWMFYQGQILGIDLADVPLAFRKGDGDKIPYGKDPLGLYVDAAAGFYRRNLSPEMRAYLRSLNPQFIRKQADDAGRFITDIQIDGMLGRAQVVLGTNPAPLAF